MTRILIAGYFGFDNAGDELILSAMVQGFRRELGSVEIVALSGNPDDTRSTHGVGSVPWTELDRIIDAICDSDLVVLGGGGLFHDYWGADAGSLLTSGAGGIPQYARIPVLAAMLGRPSIVYGVGVGPLFTDAGRDLTRVAFEAAALATVRDESSKTLLASLGVDRGRIMVTADPAFDAYLPAPERIRAKVKLTVEVQLTPPVLGVALRNWDVGVDPDNWEGMLAEGLDQFLSEYGGTILLIPFQRLPGSLTDDATVLDRVRQRMKHHNATFVVSNLPPLERGWLVACCDLVLGMRMHSLIMAARGGVPAVGIVYDPKVSSLLCSLGLEDYGIELRGISPAQVFTKLASAYTERPELGGRLLRRSRSLQRLARENVRLAIHCLATVRRPEWDQRTAVRSAIRDALKAEVGLVLHQSRLLENRDGAIDFLKKSLLERDREIQALHNELTKLRQMNEELGILLEEKDRYVGTLADEITKRDEQIRAIGESTGWALLQFLWKIRLLVAPRGSVLERVGRSAVRVIRLTKTFGSFQAAVRIFRPYIERLLLRSLFQDVYTVEDNSQVTLYTSLPGLFPEYQPRKELHCPRLRCVSVSLVATVRNERESVDRWVRSLLRQTRMPDEVIIVDGGSSDGTLELLETVASQVPIPFRVIAEPGANIARGRNVAISQARSEVIAVTDFGCMLEPRWLEALVTPFEVDPDVQVAAGWYVAVDPRGNPVRSGRWPALSEIRLMA